VAEPGQAFSIAGRLTALRLWVRSPHASIRVSARLRGAGGVFLFLGVIQPISISADEMDRSDREL
jgi:hypothetical protein